MSLAAHWFGRVTVMLLACGLDGLYPIRNLGFQLTLFLGGGGLIMTTALLLARLENLRRSLCWILIIKYLLLFSTDRHIGIKTNNQNSKFDTSKLMSCQGHKTWNYKFFFWNLSEKKCNLNIFRTICYDRLNCCEFLKFCFSTHSFDDWFIRKLPPCCTY